MQKARMQSVRDFINRKAPLLVPVALLGGGAAHAQSTGGGGGGSAAFTQAITQVSADIATYGAALVGVSAVGLVYFIAIKFIKKVRGAA